MTSPTWIEPFTMGRNYSGMPTLSSALPTIPYSTNLLNVQMHLGVLKVMSEWNLYIVFCIFQVVSCLVYEVLCGYRVFWCTHYYPYCFNNENGGGDTLAATGLAVSYECLGSVPGYSLSDLWCGSVALGHVSLPALRFPLPIIIPLVLQTHLSSSTGAIRPSTLQYQVSWTRPGY